MSASTDRLKHPIPISEIGADDHIQRALRAHRRRLIDQNDTKRRIVLNILCAQCERDLVFSKCKVGSLGECVLEMGRWSR